MIAYYCDRCGKEIVDGTIYRVAITAESVSILGTADTLATTKPDVTVESVNRK